MRLNRTIATMAVAMLAATQATAIAGRGSEEAHYNFDLTKPGTTGWFGSYYGIYFGDEVTIPVPSSAHSVDLSAVDDSASQVSVAVRQGEGEATVFCSMVSDLPVTGGQPLSLQVIIAIPAGSGCSSPELPTEGTVTATFGHHGRIATHHHHHHH